MNSYDAFIASFEYKGIEFTIAQTPRGLYKILAGDKVMEAGFESLGDCNYAFECNKDYYLTQI